MVDIDKYPVNYDNIDKQTQEKIVEFLNKHSRLFPGEALGAAKLLEEVFDIQAVYNWPGHREEWILATRDDAYDYEDCILSWRD